jgi:8-oxo-dGTP diphosphatase
MKRMYPDQPIVGIGVVIARDCNIALIKRGNEPSKGKWTIPGGLVELGESVELAVIREVKYHYVIIDYLVHVKGGDIQAASDAEELRWVPFDEVETYNLTASFRLFFRQNRKRLEKANSYH